MSFDTVTFWLFFALAWGAWRWLPFGAAKSAALVASLVFYAWWNPWYVGLLAFSSVLDYFVGSRLAAEKRPRARRAWLALSLVANLGLLGFFKYAPFAVENVAALARLSGVDVRWQLTGWVVPVGISFYTFQTLSYSLDLYWRRIQPARSLRDFFLFVAFYPQLVAGPIVRAAELLPQLERRRRLRLPRLQAGLYAIVSGLFLKIVVADNLALVVDQAFLPSAIASLSASEAWLGVVFFSVQIFADFAGYSGLAIGLALLLGLRFPENFRHPYISRGLSEFWTRWHVTLSSWLRDYLYIPLGGNRHGPARTYAALSATMLLGGLWHGASWTFVAWGALHGLGLVVERLVRGARRKRATPHARAHASGHPSGHASGPTSDRPATPLHVLVRLVEIGIVYVFVLATWVFFRAQDFSSAGAYFERLFVAPFTEPWSAPPASSARYLVLVLPVFLTHAAQLAHEWYGFRKTPLRRALWAGVLLFLVVVVRRDASHEFIYFQF